MCISLVGVIHVHYFFLFLIQMETIQPKRLFSTPSGGTENVSIFSYLVRVAGKKKILVGRALKQVIITIIPMLCLLRYHVNDRHCDILCLITCNYKSTFKKYELQKWH